jgi:glycosyltransferase involved in cell wall biosynthesis
VKQQAVTALLRWGATVVSWVLTSPRRRRSAGGPAPITFVIWNAFSTGGTVRTVVRQANALADAGRDVTVVSVLRHVRQDRPFFDIHPDVAVDVLVDRLALAEPATWRERVKRRLDQRPRLSSRFSIGRERQSSLLTDVLLLGRVARTRGIVIGTRIGINLAIARVGHPRAHRIAQEHLQVSNYRSGVRRSIRTWFPRLDVVTSLTRVDAEAYARLFPEGRPAIARVPNAIPDGFPEPASVDNHRVIAVGRLAPVKAFDQLIEAFAKVAADHPDWDLRIVGAGALRRQLQERIDGLGLRGRAVLAGRSSEVDRELATASIFVLSSHHESLPLTVLEAMAAGLTIVSYACQTGPVELLTHDRDALLAEPQDVADLTDKLRTAMDDRDLRSRLSRQAQAEARTYAVTPVTQRWLQLFDDLERGVAADRPRTPYLHEEVPRGG